MSQYVSGRKEKNIKHERDDKKRQYDGQKKNVVLHYILTTCSSLF
jgi:hypothetical protein